MSSAASADAKPALPRPAAAKVWVPGRQSPIWIDCNPQAGGEMRDIHPMLVLSPASFNALAGLVIGLPMTTAASNASNPFAVPVGVAQGRNASLVLCHQPQSFDWRAPGAKPHPQGRVADAAFAQACALLNRIVSLD